MEIRALTPAEQKYTYAQSMQLEGQTANIGHLRGDFVHSFRYGGCRKKNICHGL